MFQFPGFASRIYGFNARYRMRGGLPHSDIFGSKFARNSPKLFAACHVLHRLSVPRHPPNALITLDRRHSVQGQAAPHQRPFTRSSANQPKPSSGPSQFAFLVLLTLSNSNLLTIQERAEETVTGNPPIATRTSGGADRDRTGDLKLAKLALSQLSYGP